MSDGPISANRQGEIARIAFRGPGQKTSVLWNKISIFFVHDKKDLKNTRSQTKITTTNRSSIGDNRSQRQFFFLSNLFTLISLTIFFLPLKIFVSTWPVGWTLR